MLELEVELSEAKLEAVRARMALAQERSSRGSEHDMSLEPETLVLDRKQLEQQEARFVSHDTPAPNRLSSFFSSIARPFMGISAPASPAPCASPFRSVPANLEPMRVALDRSDPANSEILQGLHDQLSCCYLSPMCRELVGLHCVSCRKYCCKGCIDMSGIGMCAQCNKQLKEQQQANRQQYTVERNITIPYDPAVPLVSSTPVSVFNCLPVEHDVEMCDSFVQAPYGINQSPSAFRRELQKCVSPTGRLTPDSQYTLPVNPIGGVLPGNPFVFGMQSIPSFPVFFSS